MTAMNKYGSVLALAGLLTLSGCETMNIPTDTSSSGTTIPANVYSGYGVVQSIELVKQDSGGIGGSGIGIGTIAGGVIGGVLGSQVGQGSGQTAATIGGAAAGAYAGYELEKRQKQTADAYKFTIRMDNGAYQTLTQSTSADVRVGDRVKIENGVMQRY